MWLTRLAINRPVTVMMMLLSILLLPALIRSGWRGG